MVSNIEDDLREILSEKAEQAPQAAAIGLPVDLRRRIRIRQVAVVAVSTIVVAVAGLGATVGVRSLQQRSVPGGPAPAPAPSTTFLRDQGVAGYVLASDTRSRDAWTFVAYRDADKTLCLELRQRYNDASSGSCGFTVPGRPLETNAAELHYRKDARIVFGAVAKEAAQVRVRLDGGREVDGRLIGLPRGLAAPFNAFLVHVPLKIDGEIQVLDREGKLLGSERLGPPDPNFQPGDLIPASDAFGRTVGVWPYKYVFGDPSESPGGPTAPPGGRATPLEVRNFALSPLRPQPPFRRWWNTRPDPSATDTEFLEWWAAYPPPTRSRSSEPLEATTVSGRVWGVYVEVAPAGSPSLAQAVDRLLDLGVRRNAINSDGTIHCDRGAVEALGTRPSDDSVVAMYFSSKGAADQFADGLEPPPVGVVLVEIGCND